MTALLIGPACLLSLAFGQAPAFETVTTHLEREVSGTGGAYVGYSDLLESDGHFQTGPGAGGSVELRARYTWRWHSSEGEDERGAEDRTVSIDPGSRRYLDRCDLDDMDGQPPGDLATWLWVPTGLAVGDRVQILDEQGRVQGIETLQTAVGTHEALRITATGSGTRDDDYGQMRTTWTDTWWFHAQTGYFLRSEYREHATGVVDGLAGEFDLVERTERRAPDWEGLRAEGASGPELPGVEDPPSGDGCFTLACFGLITPIGLLAFWRHSRIRKPCRTVRVKGLGKVELVDVGNPHELRGLLLPQEHVLVPIMGDLGRRALAAGGRVQLARAEGRVVGLGMTEPPGRIGTVLADQDRLTQALVYNLGLQSWFATRKSGVTGPDRFQQVEDWSVLRLDAPGPQRWDPELVRRMADSQRQAVVALLESEGGDAAGPWLDAQLADGDLAFVAVLQGTVVGCGILGMHGDLGRLHGLFVHASHRGRGIGAELVRARVDAAATLGAGAVITEIASWNLASLHLAKELGFQPVGKLVVEAIRPPPTPSRTVRR